MESKLLGGDHEQRLTPLLLFSCTVAASGGFLYGYDHGISGGVSSMDSFLKEFFPDVYTKMKDHGEVSSYCKFNSQLLTFFTSSLYIAGLFASFFASHVTSRRGRLFSMRVSGAFFFNGALVGGLAINVYMLFLSRILQGIGIGFANQSITLYLSEQSPTRNRGAIFNFFNVSLTIGILFANVINYGSQKIKAGWGWRLSLGLGALPAAFLFAGAFFIPETPTSLIQRGGDLREVSLLLQRIRGTNKIQKEFSEIAAAAAEAPTSVGAMHPLRRITRRVYRPLLVFALVLPFFQQFAGMSLVGFYAPLLFRTIGLKESTSLLSTLVIKTAGTVGNLAAMPLVDRFGRRNLFLLGGALLFSSLVAVGCVMSAELGDHGMMRDACARLLMALFVIFVLGYSFSWGSLPLLLTSEIFPLEIRSAGKSIAVAADFLFTVLTAQSMMWILCHLKWGVFFFFAGWVIGMTLFIFFLLPETKGLQLEHMGTVWREHWFWKRYVEDEGEEALLGRSEERRASFG